MFDGELPSGKIDFEERLADSAEGQRIKRLMEELKEREEAVSRAPGDQAGKSTSEPIQQKQVVGPGRGSGEQEQDECALPN